MSLIRQSISRIVCLNCLDTHSLISKRWYRMNASGAKFKFRGFRKLPGDYVEKGMILYSQMGLKVFPGENVGCGRDMTLYALEPGVVHVTLDKVHPYPDSPLYQYIQDGKDHYRKFYHVIPEPLPKKFKLTSQV